MCGSRPQNEDYEHSTIFTRSKQKCDILNNSQPLCRSRLLAERELSHSVEELLVLTLLEGSAELDERVAELLVDAALLQHRQESFVKLLQSINSPNYYCNSVSNS